jgi:hypothetical protein
MWDNRDDMYRMPPRILFERNELLKLKFPRTVDAILEISTVPFLTMMVHAQHANMDLDEIAVDVTIVSALPEE